MKGVTFVTRHYREGAFSVKNGRQRLGIELPVRWTPLRIAAGIAAVIAIGATAAMVTVRYFGEGSVHPDPVAIPAAVSPRNIVRAIDFDDAALPAVLEEIRNVYGVEITNEPADAASYRLSLHYEGNADDLIATINDIFDIELIIVE